jgi:hypothetical protein
MKRISLLFLLSFGSFLFSMAQNSFGGGTGTNTDPYILNTATHFFALSDSVNAGNEYAGKYFTVSNDIDFNNENFRPIGNNFDGSSNLHYFKGLVDGQNHKVSNFNCTMDKMGIGIFGLTGTGSIIKNIHMVSGTITGSALVGSIVGYNNGTIEHCSASNQVAVSASSFYAGGVAGANAEGSTISQCVNHASVTVTGNNGMNAGGIAGGNNGIVTHCYNMGAVSVAHSYAGGIVGYSDKKCYINNCYNGGLVSAGVDYAGGIGGGVLLSTSNATNKIENCYNFGAISGSNNKAICAVSMSMTYANNHYDNSTSIASEIAARGTGQSTVAMTNGSFAATLNSGVSCWSEDLNNINSHYPVLSWQISNPIGINDIVKPDFYTYSSNSTIIVRLSEPTAGTISVFNTNGSLIAQTKITETTHSFILGAKGVYLVRINTGNGYMTKKVVLNN